MPGRVLAPFLLALALVTAPTAAAAPGDLDYGWAEAGAVNFQYKAGADSNGGGIADTVRTAGGRYVSVATGLHVSQPFWTPDLRLIGVTAGGRRDAQFGIDGLAHDWNGYLYPEAIAELPDQDLIVAAYGCEGSGCGAALFRFNPDGSKDTSYGTGGKVDLDLADFPTAMESPAYGGISLQDVAVVGDELIVYGMRSDYDANQQSVTRHFVGRLGLDGKPVTSWGTDGFVVLETSGYIGTYYHPSAFVHDPATGHVAIAGSFADRPETCAGAPDVPCDYTRFWQVLRLDASGDPVAGWGTNGVASFDGGPDTIPNKMAFAPGGKLYITGIYDHPFVLRLTATGARDAGFPKVQLTGDNYTTDLDVDPEGRLLILEYLYGSHWELHRYSADGVKDFTSRLNPGVGTGSGPSEGFIDGDRYVAVGQSAVSTGSLYFTATAWKLSDRGDPPIAGSQHPAISGTGQVPNTLTASNGTYVGGAPTSYEYTWNRCAETCQPVKGPGPDATYALGAGDAGKTITATVRAINAYGSVTRSTEPFGPIEAAAGSGPQIPVASAKPQLLPAGDWNTALPVGTVMTLASPGVWPDGTSVRWAWMRCPDPSFSGCAELVPFGNTHTTYQVTEADRGSFVGVVVQGENAAGSGYDWDFRQVPSAPAFVPPGPGEPGGPGGPAGPGPADPGFGPGVAPSGELEPPAGLTPARTTAECVASGRASLDLKTLLAGKPDGLCALLVPSAGTITVGAYLGSAPPVARAASAGRKRVTLGFTKVAVQPGYAPVKLKLSRKGRKALKRKKKSKVTFVVTYTPAGGAPVRSVKSFKLK